MTPDWALPIVFKMAKKGGRDDERRPTPMHGIGNVRAILGSAKADLLLHALVLEMLDFVQEVDVRLI